MKRVCFVICVLLFVCQLHAQKNNEKASILQILHTQDEAWNKGDIEGFMQTYWQNDSLMFIGKSGVTYGWNNTLNNYKRSYPDTASMGKLNFTLIDIKRLSNQYYHVVGKWHLKRTKGDLQGHFTLLLQKIKKKWVIVADHSS